MPRLLTSLLLLAAGSVAACARPAPPAAVQAGAPVAASPLAPLLHAYPRLLAGVEGGDLVWRDGTRMPVSNGHDSASLEAMIRDGSILDQMRAPYPAGPQAGRPDDDAGRVRNRAFFDRMYGDCTHGEVTPHLVAVTWLPRSWRHPVMFTSVNGAATALQAVSDELDALPDSEKRFLYPLGGSYVCRGIADSGSRSMHAYGAAIDINVALSDYWLWEHSQGPRHQTPPDIVAIFERHGFIWGGKWSHYDTMHFEYRPELLGQVAAE